MAECSEQYKPRSVNTETFPSKWGSSFSSLAEYENDDGEQEIVPQAERDRRKVYDTNKIDFHSRIGLLRMKFEGEEQVRVGTATVFYCKKRWYPYKNRAYAITCAHCIIHYNAIRKTLHWIERIWFDRTTTTNWKLFNTTKSRQKYEIDSVWVHPRYSPKEKGSPYDLAIVSFVDTDLYYIQNEPAMVNIAKPGYHDIRRHRGTMVDVEYPFEGYSIFGYPSERRGQLWGDCIARRISADEQEAKRPFATHEDDNSFGYTMHTSGGQSGSAIVKTVAAQNHSHSVDAVWDTKVYTQQVHQIIGIHTYGIRGSGENGGVKVDRDWIVKCVQSIDQAAEQSAILALF